VALEAAAAGRQCAPGEVQRELVEVLARELGSADHQVRGGGRQRAEGGEGLARVEAAELVVGAELAQPVHAHVQRQRRQAHAVEQRKRVQARLAAELQPQQRLPFGPAVAVQLTAAGDDRGRGDRQLEHQRQAAGAGFERRLRPQHREVGDRVPALRAAQADLEHAVA
jgi:hypothetical protein